MCLGREFVRVKSPLLLTVDYMDEGVVGPAYRDHLPPARRVHSTIPVGVGSPDATPRVNGEVANRGFCNAAPAKRFRGHAAYSAAVE